MKSFYNCNEEFILQEYWWILPYAKCLFSLVWYEIRKTCVSCVKWKEEILTLKCQQNDQFNGSRQVKILIWELSLLFDEINFIRVYR